MRLAAGQADVMVPVIAGRTIEQGDNWARYIIRDEWKLKISSVIITMRDLVADSSLVELPLIAAKCAIPGRENCVLLCDTPQGMAAMQLQLFLDEIERKYAANPISPDATAETDQRMHQEAAKIITGITDAAGPFHRVS